MNHKFKFINTNKIDMKQNYLFEENKLTFICVTKFEVVFACPDMYAEQYLHLAFTIPDDG